MLYTEYYMYMNTYTVHLHIKHVRTCMYIIEELQFKVRVILSVKKWCITNLHEYEHIRLTTYSYIESKLYQNKSYYTVVAFVVLVWMLN